VSPVLYRLEVKNFRPFFCQQLGSVSQEKKTKNFNMHYFQEYCSIWSYSRSASGLWRTWLWKCQLVFQGPCTIT